MSNAITIAAYEEHVQEYLEKSPQEVSDDIKAWFEEALSSLGTDARILELGCGTGKDANYIESLGYSVDRTDATKAFVEFQIEHGHEARVLNALTNDFGSDIDLILADAVLLHFTPKELQLVVAKSYAALSDNGRFAFSLKQGDGEEVNDEKLGAPRYFKYWQEAEIIRELELAGFDRFSVRTSEDYRGPQKPGWLMITAYKGKKDE